MAHQHGIILGYFVSYADLDFSPHIVENTLLPCAEQTNTTVISLLPYRRYDFTVAAFTSVGKSNNSESIVCVTKEAGKFSSDPNRHKLWLKHE